MRNLASPGFLLALTAMLVGASPSTAHAYLDPGTGSIILQVLLGGVAGLALACKLYWKKFVSSSVSSANLRTFGRSGRTRAGVRTIFACSTPRDWAPHAATAGDQITVAACAAPPLSESNAEVQAGPEDALIPAGVA